MPAHRRGRSLSEALTLEQSDEGGLVISSIKNASANQGLREGDELLGATINFDKLSKEEVLKVLKLMEPFDDKVQVLTRSNLSKSVGNLDQCAKSPETMLQDSYSKLYNARIKRFMRGDVPGAEEGYENGEPAVAGSSKVSLKHDMGLPRLGVDFGLLKTKSLSTDLNADSESEDVTFSAGDGSNLNLPPLGLGLSGAALSGAQVPRLKVDARNPQLDSPDFRLSRTLPEGPNVNATAGIQVPNTDLTMPNLERPHIGLEGKGAFKTPEIGGSDVSTPEMGINLNGGNITGPSFNTGVPKVGIEGTNRDFKMPKFKVPDLGLSGPSFSGPEGEIETPDVRSPDVNLKYSKKLKKPDLNVDNLSGYIESPKLRLSGRSPDLDLEMPQLDLNGPDVDMPSGGVKMSLKKPKIDFKSPDLDVDAPRGKLTMPKFGFSGKHDADIKTPDLSLKTPKIKGGIHAPDTSLPKVDLKGPNLAIDTPSADIKGPSGKYTPPKFTMPKFDLPNIKVPDFNGDFQGPDVQLAAPGLRAGIGDPNIDLNVPSAEWDITSPSGKLKMPGFGLSGPKVKGPEYELKTPDMDVSAPKFKGGINLPNVDLKDPKLDLSTPDVDVDMPSGKFDIDADAPSGKLKMPKFKLFGTLPKNKDVDINAGMKTPELSLKSPKIRGIDAPDVSVPNMDLKAPNVDHHAPDVNIGSPKGKLTMPKLKMPNLDLSGPKGNIDVDASLNRPDLPSGGFDVDLSKPEFDIDAPSLDLKGPRSKLKMPDANIGSPSGKLKMPGFTMPDFDLSGPKLKGLDGELKTPDFDVNDPDMHVNAPSGKLKMPKFNLSGTLPKGPNMDLNADLKSSDLSLKAPKIKGGIDGPDLDLPDMDLTAPKLDVNTPDLNIGSPNAKLNMPKFKKPKFGLPGLKGPEIEGNLDGPDFDINAPNVNLKGPKADLDDDIAGPSGKFKKPNFNMPDFGLSAPKLDGPNLNLKSPDLDISGADLSGG
ncbi:neuroblast differentiation-associated protein AHNAK-like protein [Lates japonicus]|uniref:Neuroblast differentiation-associated protein AHNAK-like protein n=1 Tax=Lates japonicus TaxID=270547 RepID=A0AAD3NAQ6_LATJO|nr:neuroblast differentiation-associated protein AHNAK-like protein [Lates japonicus]